MQNKEIITYMIVDTAQFTKKVVKKTTKFSFLCLIALGVVSAAALGTDYMIHKNVYQQNNIFLTDLVNDNNRFNIDLQSSVHLDNIQDSNSENNPKTYLYVPFTHEFELNFEQKNLEYLAIKNNQLNQLNKYKDICNLGIISELICFKYNKIKEINTLKKSL